MKKYICVILSMLFILISVTGHDTISASVETVFICKSGTSYAYHRKMCSGLRRCTHKIEEVTVREAIAMGNGKPCGYCYRK